MNDLRLLVPGQATVIPPRKKSEDQVETPEDLRKFYPRTRAAVNAIPSDDQIERLIARAQQALAKGIFWDRGSIVNIVL